MSTKKIKYSCTRCGNPYYVRPCDIKKRKTTLCISCILKKRNQSQEMREISRRNGSRSKSTETRRKLSAAQRKYWTPERRKARSATGNPVWSGGRTITSGGYVYQQCPGHPRATRKGNYVLEHILIMEDHLGRYLVDGEVVHHINGNKTDNRIENLRLYSSHSKHLSIAHYGGEE